MLHMDYETRSESELGGLRSVGLDNYLKDPTTEVLMMAWAFDKDEPQVWFPGTPLPTEVVKYWNNAVVHAYDKDFEDFIAAFNSPFERGVTREKVGYDIPAAAFQDPQASARYLSLPASLEDVGSVLGLPTELRKDKRGEELVDLFSYPQTRTKKQGGGTYFNTKETHPKDWEDFVEYCKQDVRSEREVARRLGLLRVYPLPPRERQIWLFDQKVNDRGMPTDRLFVEKAFRLADKNKKEKLDEQNLATGLENANSADQLMPWAQDRGYPINNLRKQNIELVLKDPDVDMTEECRAVLTARMEASSTSYKKLQSIMRNISKDGKLRNQFIYMGSARCGRWSGNSVQLHNMARPDGTFEDMDNVTKARQLIYDEDYDGLKIAFKKKEGGNYSPLIIAKNVIRTVFVAPEGKRFNVCDLNAIETRVAAWVAECQSLLDVFANKRDPYLDFAVKMTGIPYEKLAADVKSKDPKIKAEAKRHRQIAKPGVLGAVYRLGAGGWGRDKNGDKIKTGLWGYAEAMGVDMSQEQAADVVKIFRESYPEICGNGYQNQMKGIWVRLEEAVLDVLNSAQTVRTIGPDNCIRIDKLTIKDRLPILRIQLPSGRYLHYIDAAVETVKMPWKSTDKETGEVKDVYRPAFTYYGMDQDTKFWDMIVSHGGKIFENIVQGIARDVLADKLLEFEQIGLETVGHVHDEGICLSDDDPFAPGVQDMEKIMNTPVSWAESLPLGSDGFEDYFYHK